MTRVGGTDLERSLCKWEFGAWRAGGEKCMIVVESPRIHLCIWPKELHTSSIRFIVSQISLWKKLKRSSIPKSKRAVESPSWHSKFRTIQAHLLVSTSDHQTTISLTTCKSYSHPFHQHLSDSSASYKASTPGPALCPNLLPRMSP